MVDTVFMWCSVVLLVTVTLAIVIGIATCVVGVVREDRRYERMVGRGRR